MGLSVKLPSPSNYRGSLVLPSSPMAATSPSRRSTLAPAQSATASHLEQYGQVQVQQRTQRQQQQVKQQAQASSQQGKPDQEALDTGQPTVEQRLEAQQALEDYSYIK